MIAPALWIPTEIGVRSVADYEEDSMHSVKEIEEKIRQRYRQPKGSSSSASSRCRHS
jgi:hypothetical protein